MKDNMSTRDRVWPWIEGLLFATVVLIVISLGGESLRTSYHGLLHTSIGEAVLRDGLLPENPYHAGSQLSYYTLYPSLGVLLGKLGGGPLWGFALLNIFAALLMGPALDSVGRRLGLCHMARRFAFWSMILGFNAFGYWCARGVPVPPLGAMPMLILEPLTNVFGLTSFDARLQSFTAKFLNVSSFACSLPFMLFALSNALRDAKRSNFVAACLLGLCVAINPLVGAFATLLIVSQAMLVDGVRKQLIVWSKLGIVSALIALPFLLPLVLQSGHEQNEQPQLPFVGDGALQNVIGPNLLLLVLAAASFAKLNSRPKKVLAAAIVLALLFSFSHLPFGNEYKFPRLLAIFLALPAGNFFIGITKRHFRWAVLTLLVIVALPTTFVTARAYSFWNVEQSLTLRESPNGNLIPRDDSAGLPSEVISAIGGLDSDVVLMMNPRHPGAASIGLGSQGNQWAPVLGRTLFVDKPQIHNQAHMSEVRRRLDMSIGFWSNKRWPAKPDSAVYISSQALEDARLEIAGRPLAIVSLAGHRATHDALEQHSDATLVSRQGDVCLWLFSAAPKADEN
jgi:hypothetical protein